MARTKVRTFRQSSAEGFWWPISRGPAGEQRYERSKEERGTVVLDSRSRDGGVVMAEASDTKNSKQRFMMESRSLGIS